MHRFDNLLQFYSILYRIVKAWPATYNDATSQETRSERINTFAVVRSQADFDADNLKKTVEYTSRDFFFSRPFHDSGYQPNALRVEYPALGVREEQFSLNDPLDAASGKRRTTHNLTFLLSDQIPYKENSFIDPTSSQRKIEEVGDDLRVRMAQLLLVLGRYVYARAYLVGALVFEGWHDKQLLDAMRTAGTEIDQYIIDDALPSYVTNVQPTTGEIFYETGSDNLAICAVSLTIETNSCFDLPVMNYESPIDPEDRFEVSELEFPPS